MAFPSLRLVVASSTAPAMRNLQWVAGAPAIRWTSGAPYTP